MKNTKTEIDVIIDKLAPLGVPGLIFLVLMSFSPWAGGAAIMSTLALLGGPFGAIAGLGVLGVFSVYGKKISAFGYNKVIFLLVERMKNQGKDAEAIVEEVQNFPISEKLKSKITHEILNAEIQTPPEL